MSNASHIRLGSFGEELACQHLRRLGFELLKRNFRTRFGELDVVARRSNLIVFCEVKTRRASSSTNELPDPMLSIHPLKCRQVRRMAGAWLATQPHKPISSEIRFDAIGLILDESDRLLVLDHREGAF